MARLVLQLQAGADWTIGAQVANLPHKTLHKDAQTRTQTCVAEQTQPGGKGKR
jgi:hypothetical protein